MTPTDGRAAQGRELRIGDAERTVAADELGEHYAQGRLTTEEHLERLDRVMAARTRSELTPIFSDLPGSAYQVPASYWSAERPGVGTDRPRRGRRPFPAPPFGGPPFGRPPYGASLRGPRNVRIARGPGGVPLVLRLVLVVLLAVLVLTHLPLILIGVVVWLVLVHKHRRWHSFQRRW
jgi:hypothetical protein